MNERLVLDIIYRINSIIYVVIFYLIINKIYDRRKVTKNLDYIVIFIITILTIIIPKFWYRCEYIIYNGVLLTLLSKKVFKILLKDAFIWGMCFIFGYGILRDTIDYLCLLMLNIIRDAPPIAYVLYTSIPLTIILILVLKYFDKIVKSNLNIKYYIYIGFTVVTNIVCILCLIKSNRHIEDIYDFIITNNINTYIDNNNFITVNFIPFIEFTKHSVIIAIIFCNIFLIFIINNIIKKMKDESEMKSLNDKLDMQYNHYLSIQESQMKVRKLYHDINNHMACIKELQNEDVNEYIDSINEELKEYKNTFTTNNMILDIILNEKNSVCKKNNIELTCDINFSKYSFIEMIDISSIFSNIIDNAIEACKKVEDNRYISIRGTVVKSYYVIKCKIFFR
ncbi:GHKL domain-containing protein [Romboutsia lituseburensis]|uniref:GHKL domain-containing protein n=1 Tax=Romboutsia lituseburensis TaxID=1537 RepID=UPI00215B60FA|nr:GHKL domain-containing protein [Romboutsia lituseburensis]MCR8744683.1 GHKL domain-containing protein [Romboutsia lituseburensis]